LWVIIAILFLLIIAAVVIPVGLIVIPRRRQAHPTGAVAGGCEASFPCLNNGVSVRNGNFCGCVCLHGFGGAQCSERGDDNCLTVDALSGSGGYRNATVGSALPRLFADSFTNFSIPLNSSKIVDLFSSGFMSCTSENALVTFNGASMKRQYFAQTHRDGHRYHHKLFARSPVDAEPSQTPTADSTTLSPSPSSATSPSSTTSPTAEPTPSGSVLDFSRVAVLFILEQTGVISSATSAHDSIQAFLDGRLDNSVGDYSDPMGVSSLKHNFTLNFVKFTITIDNGTVVGGK
jgi:hypothetical protein